MLSRNHLHHCGNLRHRDNNLRPQTTTHITTVAVGSSKTAAAADTAATAAKTATAPRL